MDKIVGRVIGVVCLCMTLHMQAKMSMEVTSFDGHKVNEVAAGEAFLIKVSVDDAQDAKNIQIKGLKDFSVRKTGYSLITINGEKTAQLTYQVRIDRPGTYKVGPAFNPSNKQRSNTERIHVETEQVTASRARRAGRKKQQNNDHVLLRLWTDKDTFFVGQKIKTVLRLYFAESENISVDQIVTNDPDTIDVTDKKGPKKGTQTLDGQDYIFLEWQWDMFAREPGKLVIPAYFVDYNKQLPMQQSLGSFAMFFGPRYERKRVYSNALTLQVKRLPPLPDDVSSVDAVGSFLSYTASVKPAVAKKYEGLVLQLKVEGDGSMHMLKEPTLSGMPKELKYYSSKATTGPSRFGTTKTYEYIVQGLEQGEWHIPEQKLTYFDVDNQSYKTAKASPLFVTILPEQTAPSIRAQECVTQAENTDELDQIAPLATYRLPHDQVENSIPFIWYVILFISATLAMYLYYAAFYSGWLLEKIAPYYIKRRAFKRAHKQLALAYRHQNTRALLDIFKQLITHRLMILQNQLTTDDIQQLVDQSVWPAEQKQAWHVFYDKISQAAYAGTQTHKETLRFFHEAARWIAELERILT